MRAAEAIPSEQMRHWAQCEGREKQYWNHPRFGCLPSSYHDRGQTLHATHKNGLSKGTHKNGEEYKNEAMLNVIGKALADIQSYFGGSAATWYAESRPTDKKARSNKKPWEAVLAGVFEVRLKRQPKDHYVFYERVLNDIGAFEAGADLAEYYGVRKAAQGSSSLGTYTKPGVASSEWAKKMPTWITKAKEVGSIALCTDGGAENEAHLAFTYLQAAHEAHPDTHPDVIGNLEYRGHPADNGEPARQVFMDSLKAQAKAAGYPEAWKIMENVYRATDLYAGNTYGRALVTAEKLVLLWYFGSEKHDRSMSASLLAASDGLKITYFKCQA